MNPEKKVFQTLTKLQIPYQSHEHPPTPSVEDALPIGRILRLHIVKISFSEITKVTNTIWLFSITLNS